MKVGVVIPFAPGREENLEFVLTCLARQTIGPPPIVVVLDGMPGSGEAAVTGLESIHLVGIDKHQPGMEQPRNIGVRELLAHHPDCTHVWFLDSDVIVEDDALDELVDALRQGPEDRILVAPYEWMPQGHRPTRDELGSLPAWYHGFRNDPRWAQFNASEPSRIYLNDLSAGLACLSGNLLWPISEFQRVGGFWAEINHGRCEDGELGLRAVAMEVPISFAAEARGWHLWHPINHARAVALNARDVPLLNERHPWMEQCQCGHFHSTPGARDVRSAPCRTCGCTEYRPLVFMTDRDGAAFDVNCPVCHTVVQTIAWWAHAEEHGHDLGLPVKT